MVESTPEKKRISGKCFICEKNIEIRFPENIGSRYLLCDECLSKMIAEALSFEEISKDFYVPNTRYLKFKNEIFEHLIPPKTVTQHCSICGKEFQDAITYWSRGRNFLCNDCLEKMIEKGEKPFLTISQMFYVSINRYTRARKKVWKPREKYYITGKCDFCGKEFEARTNLVMKRGRKLICDECLEEMIIDQMKLGEISKEYYVSQLKYVELRRKLGFPSGHNLLCKACGKIFNGASNQRFCYQPGCPSVLIRKHTVSNIPITKTYKDTGEPAAKIVVCDPSNKTRDKLFAAFPEMVDDKTFNEIRKILVVGKGKGRHFKPSAVAAAVFYVLTRYAENKPPYRKIRKISGVSEVTVRNYVRSLEKILGEETWKFVTEKGKLPNSDEDSRE